MCLGELGVIERVDGDVATVRTPQGAVVASILLAPEVAPGDHVVVHSGHVLACVSAPEAAEAARLRRTASFADLFTPRTSIADPALGGP